MENGEISSINYFELKLPSEIKQELGPQNLKNLTNFSSTLKEEIEKKGIEGHLFLVGGIVMPEKIGKKHKDIDLLFYSKDICVGNIRAKENDEDFANFAEFFKDVGNKLGWDEKVNNPYFYSYQFCGDGSIELKPPNGVSLEIIPTRKDGLNNSFENYVENRDRPGVLLF
jgi:hypothetical protein